MLYQLSYSRLADQLIEQQADKHQAATRGEETHRQRHADTNAGGNTTSGGQSGEPNKTEWGGRAQHKSNTNGRNDEGEQSEAAKDRRNEEGGQSEAAKDRRNED